jgi:hypothetical protein
MKQERIILSFIMVLIGLLVAGTAFYFYQSGKKAPTKTDAFASPTPASNKNTTFFLTLDKPSNEAVVNNKTLTVSGKTSSNATVLVITKSDQQILKPDPAGSFSANLTIDNDQNLITVIAIMSNGESKQIQTTVTYSTSSF